MDQKIELDMLASFDSSCREARSAIDLASRELVEEYTRPSVVFRPRIFQDGTAFCALLGDNIQEGIVAFGDTPSMAARAFDVRWHQKAAQVRRDLR